jgi:hypothetical protein
MFTSNVNAFSHLGKGLIIILISAVSYAEVSCGRTQEIQPIPMETVMKAVHDYGNGHHPTDIRSKTLADLCLANCYEGRYYRQIAPRKAVASPFLNGLGDSETIGAAKRTATKSAHTA